jgi:tetratricopeptide (TPR) repeat protein
LLKGDQYMKGRSWFEVEHDNLRAGLRFLLQPGSVGTNGRTGLRLCAVLAEFWQAGGYYPEMRRWLEQAIDLSGGQDSPELARCLTELALTVTGLGALDEGMEHASRSVEMWRRMDDRSGLPRALEILGESEVERGHYDTARALQEEALLVAGDAGDDHTRMCTLGELANLDFLEHRYEQSIGLFRQAIAIARELGDPVQLVITQHNLACTLHKMGRFDEAAKQMLDQADQILRLNQPLMLIVFAEDYAATLAELGAHRDAVRLLGVADAMRDRGGTARPPSQMAFIAEPMARTRKALEPQEWEATYQAGRATTWEDALAQTPAETALPADHR